MADPNLQYDPISGWEDQTKFPTNPSDNQVRGLFQKLHNQTRDFINTTLITWITTTFVKFADVLSRTNTDVYAPTAQYHPATKKYVDDTTAGVVLGQIPNGTITQPKLAFDVATQEELDAHTQDIANAGTTGRHGIRIDNNKLQYNDGTQWKTVSGGLPVGNVSTFVATAGNAKITLTWADPTDVTASGATIAKWKGTKILRKTGSYPTNENDGTVVVNSSTRDQYKTTGFQDTGLTNSTQYYYTAFPYTDGDVYTNDVANRVTATPQPDKIYGVKIDTTNSNSATAVTYTDDAVGLTPASGGNGTFSGGSWLDKFPFNLIKPCMYNAGSVNYYLKNDDYTKKADSTAATTDGSAGDVMVEFPKMYWHIYKSGTDLYVKFSDTKIDSNYKALAHMRGTTEYDKCYIGAYLGWFNGSDKLRSLRIKSPTVSQTIGTFRAQAKNNGAKYDLFTYYQMLMLQVLFVVMFKSLDSQTALGKGYTGTGNTVKYDTGSKDTNGMFWGSNSDTVGHNVKFCGIEDFYGNVYQWIDGLYCDSSRNILIGNQSFSDTGSGYTNMGSGGGADIGGYIKDVQGTTETGFIIKTGAGSTSTYYADYGDLCAGYLPIFGGFWSGGASAGAFRLSVSYSSSSSEEQ